MSNAQLIVEMVEYRCPRCATSKRLDVGAEGHAAPIYHYCRCSGCPAGKSWSLLRLVGPASCIHDEVASDRE